MAGELLQAHFLILMYCKRPHSNKCPPPIKHLPPGAKISNKRPSQMYPPPLPINLLSKTYPRASLNWPLSFQ